MAVVRYWLLIVTAICLIGLSYVLITNVAPNNIEPWWGWVVLCGIWITWALNFVYLIMNAPKAPEWRLFRLIRLWFDAKENELRARAKRAAPPPE